MRLYGGVRLLGSGPSVRNVEKLDRNALPMICEMARVGMMIDHNHFLRLEKILIDSMERTTEEIRSLTGHFINVGSGDQVANLLFKILGLKQARVQMTKSGDRESVEDQVLKAISHDHPVVPLIMNYKEYEKLLGTYCRPIQKLAKNGIIYPNFRTTRVPSGRLSCSDPNLLAIPNRTEMGREIRKGFIAPSGWVYCSIDESQIEVRLAASSSGDPNLIRVYENEEDIYSDFATTAFQLPDKRYKDSSGWHYPGIDKNEHRFPAKTCILASIYDVTAKGLLEQMPTIYKDGRPVWTEEKCQRLINAFYMKYPGVLQDRKRHHAMMRRCGYVWDMWGRLLHVAAVRSVLPWVVSTALREGANFPYQSGAQGTIKLVQAAVFDDFSSGGLLGDVVKFQLQIHDELLMIVRSDMAQEVAEHVKWRFETMVPLRVPIKANWSKAVTWGALEK